MSVLGDECEMFVSLFQDAIDLTPFGIFDSKHEMGTDMKGQMDVDQIMNFTPDTTPAGPSFSSALPSVSFNPPISSTLHEIKEERDCSNLELPTASPQPSLTPAPPIFACPKLNFPGVHERLAQESLDLLQLLLQHLRDVKSERVHHLFHLFVAHYLRQIFPLSVLESKDPHEHPLNPFNVPQLYRGESYVLLVNAIVLFYAKSCLLSVEGNTGGVGVNDGVDGF